MQVINKSQDGRELDLEKITVPKDNIVYQTIEGIYVRQGSQSTVSQE